MSWRETTAVSERLKLCRLAVEDQLPVAKLAREFGVSRKTAHKWIARYKDKGEMGVFDHSRRPIHSPYATGDDLTQDVISLHEEFPVWGPRKLHNVLCRRKRENVSSVSTVARILDRQGLRARSESEVIYELVGCFERSRPNELWQIDFTSPIKLADGRKIYPVPILDDHSRYCLSLTAALDTSCKSALYAFSSAASVYGMPEEILSDHGGAFGSSPTFISAFTAYMWALDIRHTQGRYAHPQTQGKLERFNRTLRTECILRCSYTIPDDWSKAFEEYRNLYNSERPHQSLQYRTPQEVYRSSNRAFVEPDKSFKPDGDELLHRRVQADGRICLMQHRFDVGNGLAGWMVSAKHEGHGIWNIYFRGRMIRQVLLPATIGLRK